MNHRPPVHAIKLTASAIFLVALLTTGAVAQRSVSRHFPAGKNVRLELKNLSGTITVETWNRDEIKITASMDTPKVSRSIPTATSARAPE